LENLLSLGALKERKRLVGTDSSFASMLADLHQAMEKRDAALGQGMSKHEIEVIQENRSLRQRERDLLITNLGRTIGRCLLCIVLALRVLSLYRIFLSTHTHNTHNTYMPPPPPPPHPPTSYYILPLLSLLLHVPPILIHILILAPA
jgi:hypothetical protein